MKYEHRHRKSEEKKEQYRVQTKGFRKREQRGFRERERDKARAREREGQRAVVVMWLAVKTEIGVLQEDPKQPKSASSAPKTLFYFIPNMNFFILFIYFNFKFFFLVTHFGFS